MKRNHYSPHWVATESDTSYSVPDAMETFHRTAELSAFNVSGARRIANGSAVSYVFPDGSRFVVSDAKGYHAVIDASGHEWARRQSSCVARGTP